MADLSACTGVLILRQKRCQCGGGLGTTAHPFRPPPPTILLSNWMLYPNLTEHVTSNSIRKQKEKGKAKKAKFKEKQYCRKPMTNYGKGQFTVDISGNLQGV